MFMNFEKISHYFFIIAAIITIFDGVFNLTPEMMNVKFIVLIFSGLVVGVLRDRNYEQFFLSGLVFIISGYVLLELVRSHMMLAGIVTMIIDFVVFLGASLFILALERVVVDITSLSAKPSKAKKSDFLKFKKIAEKDVETHSFERIWGTIILVAVALTFISLLAQLFFQVGAFLIVFKYVDALITVIFIADLIVLYLQSRNFKDFVTRHVVDIIAAIPTVGVLRVLKLVRALRIIRIVRGGAKLGEAVKLYKTMKFFSEESYFNKIEHEKKQRSKKTSQKNSSSAKGSSRKTSRASKKRSSARKTSGKR